MATFVSPARVSQRLVSLDVFRGFTMAAMVLVNNGGDGDHIYPQLAHAAWNGWTFTDWIFPFFLWISGMSTTYAVAARRARGATTREILLQVLRRSALIFLVGLFLNGFPFGLNRRRQLHAGHMAHPGSLQRIAICYLVGSFLYCWMPSAGSGSSSWHCSSPTGRSWSSSRCGVGAGSWERGRNFAAYIDELVIGSHAYARTRPWDPEGIISTLPAIATFLFGILAGDYLRRSKSPGEGKTSWFFRDGVHTARDLCRARHVDSHQQEALDAVLRAHDGRNGRTWCSRAPSS